MATQDTRLLLARTLQMEAGNQGLSGMVDVGSVIRNRVASGRYGEGIEGVIMKAGQFSAWNAVTGYAGGDQGQDTNFEPSDDAFAAADAILSGQYEDRTGGATNYFAVLPNSPAPRWADNSFRKTDGDHFFGNADGTGPIAGNTGPIAGAGDTELAGGPADDQIADQSDWTNVHNAYNSGEMSDPEHRAQYEAAIASGAIPPDDAAPQQAPAASQNIYDAYVNGMMTDEHKAQYETGVISGAIPSPATANQMQSMVTARDTLTPAGEDIPPASKPIAVDGQSRASELSQGGFDTAGAALRGAAGLGPSVGAGLIPERVSLYGEGGPAFNIPAGVRQVAGQALDVPIAGLSAIGGVLGAGAGAVGDVAEFAGMSAGSADRLSRDLSAAPEAFAGSPSSLITPNAALRAGTQVRQATRAQQVAPQLAEAERAGVRVLTSDIKPPETFAARGLQAIGERIPVAGTGPVRAAQVRERVAAVKNIVTQFANPEVPINSVLKNITDDLLKQWQLKVNKYVEAKNDVINRLSTSGDVDTTGTIAEIDRQISALTKMGKDGRQPMSQLQPVVDTLNDWRDSIKGKDLGTIERIREQMGESFSGVNNVEIKSAADRATRAIYDPLRTDMGNFIRANGDSRDVTKWMVSNRRLSEGMNELGVTALRNVLKKGSETPEIVKNLLFSQNTSDVARLYRNLSPEGRSNARSAVMLRALEKSGGIDDISAAKFATQVSKLGNQIGVIFKADDRDLIRGLVGTLKLTQQADRAGLAPPTGVQNFYSSILGGAGVGALFSPAIAKTVAVAGSIGLSTRAYESGPMRKILLRMSRVKSGTEAEKNLLREFYAAIPSQQTATTGAIAGTQTQQNTQRTAQ